MESTITKTSRTPSRCREWERNRRNKFNDAISRLGNIVKEIIKSSNAVPTGNDVPENKCNNVLSKEGDNVQYPKVEIVEKAIVFLTNFIQEKTQLKAEILALQVNIEAIKNQNHEKKDASTQVFIGINRKKQNGKYVKVLMLKKPKCSMVKEKPVSTPNVTISTSSENIQPSTKSLKQNVLQLKLPMLLPRASANDKKGSENTIVVLPAAPYIFPQRPLLFPTVPPAFVLVDSNVQNLNKHPYPSVNRNTGDITKTTMVNILPISAYSRPLSATKYKKNILKSKTDIPKKTTKKPKQAVKINKDPVVINNSVPNNDDHNKKESIKIVKINGNDKEVTQPNEDCAIPKNTISETSLVNKQNNSFKNTDTRTTSNNNKEKPAEIIDSSKSTNISKSTEEVVSGKTTIVQKNSENIDQINKSSKNVEKEVVDKDKENKLPNILDTALCEHTVDGGNARLELAEEFLAASPTAAFLMSFPLVSGNRADSPAEEPQNVVQVNSKYSNQRRNDVTSQTIPYFEKPATDIKVKADKSQPPSNTVLNKPIEQNKYTNSNVLNKQIDTKTSNTTSTTNVAQENPFLNLPMSSLIQNSCTLSDSTFGLDFDCNITKSIPTQPTSYVSNSNFFYKSDPFSTVKSTIYSTSSISSGHEFNSFGLYPCAMEKYTAKTKCDYPNVEENLMKIGSSRLTYDIDLGWSHKGFDFVNCTTTSNTFSKDNILTTATGPYSTSYNPFNPDFHVPLVANNSKKDNSIKQTSSIAETISSLYSQPTNLWSEDAPFYTNSNVSKSLTSKNQNYVPLEPTQPNLKPNLTKQYEAKQIPETPMDNVIKTSHVGGVQQLTDKYASKKTQHKMHINWMTSEIRPMQSNCSQSQNELKETQKTPYGHVDHGNSKKQDQSETNYFPISMLNFPSQSVQEELQTWPSSRPAGTTEISIEPPPINLPTLVGDLALGPHDKKKVTDSTNRGGSQSDVQNCSNFFSVTQLMNRSTDSNIPSRYQGPNIEAPKSVSVKQNIAHSTNDGNRKVISRLESHLPQPCYVFNESKANNYENVNQFPQNKTKSSKPDKNSKAQKNSYSAEALIRGGTCSQKIADNSSNKFMMPSQKYNDYNSTQDSSVAQVSHFPAIIDYSDNTYAGQQFSGTNLYNSTTNTLSNSFYSNFMPGSSNLMSGNYTSGPFTSDFIDYNQTTECNYTNHKYEELKIRNNPPMFQQDKVSSNYKSSRRESAAKHKLECSKKDSKKYQSKRSKLNTEIEEWSDSSHLLWQNKAPAKRHSNLMSEELPFPNYVGNQMPAQYQPDFFNSHIMSTNMQNVGQNADRTISSFPVTSRANFNLSTIFPEITMKVQ